MFSIICTTSKWKMLSLKIHELKIFKALKLFFQSTLIGIIKFNSYNQLRINLNLNTIAYVKN